MMTLEITDERPLLDATVPAYLAIRKYVLELISGPDFGPGDHIPSERTLAERLGKNRMTVRKAIDGLIAEGLLERNSTNGTRVPLPSVARPIDARSSLGISRIIQSGGGAPGNKLLHFEQARASAKVAEQLHIREGEDIVMFRRLWTVNDRPFCIETSHLPLALVPDLAAEDLMAGQSLYGLLRDRYDIGAVSGEREISVASASEMEARLLGLADGAAGLLLRLVVYAEDGRPLEYMRSMNHPQLVVFRTQHAEFPG
ncbi:GntR family transcriptional regulator [Brevundimonas sp. CEF1]|uniref:GntR family transcriptional regulator n=1 Tax=Brevundimonas sp. CEF1 TaxID=3442642 RepID=UPI003F516FE7